MTNLTYKSLYGTFIPFTTPFDDTGAIDYSGIQSNLRFWCRRDGLTGFVALGSTGERVHLSEGEALRVIETARETIPSTHSLIIGVGQQSTRGTIEEVRQAAKLGADAVLLITPSFYRRAIDQTALREFYTEVADTSPVPVILYNMPDLTGITIAPETVAQLALHANIIGMKDSSADLVNMLQTLRLVPDDFAVLTGNGPLFYAALSAGANGAILAVGCVAIDTVLGIMSAFASGDFLRARDLHRNLVPLARKVTTDFGIGGLKAAMEMIGLAGGTVRRPLRAPGEEAKQEIARALAEAVSDSQILVSIADV